MVRRPCRTHHYATNILLLNAYAWQRQKAICVGLDEAKGLVRHLDGFYKRAADANDVHLIGVVKAPIENTKVAFCVLPRERTLAHVGIGPLTLPNGTYAGVAHESAPSRPQ